MLDRSKYDIMESEEMNASKAMIGLLFDIHKEIQRAEECDISAFELNAEITKLISKAFFNFKLMAHVGYENAKDLFNIDISMISSSVKNINSFSSDYEKVINRYAKALLIFCILDEEGIELSSVSDMVTFNSIIAGNTKGLLAFLASNGRSLSKENCELAARLIDERLVVSDLDQSQIKRLNEYHDDFMKRYINPKITTERTEKERVLVQAKRISTAGKLNQ